LPALSFFPESRAEAIHPGPFDGDGGIADIPAKLNQIIFMPDGLGWFPVATRSCYAMLKVSGTNVVDVCEML